MRRAPALNNAPKPQRPVFRVGPPACAVLKKHEINGNLSSCARHALPAGRTRFQFPGLTRNVRLLWVIGSQSDKRGAERLVQEYTVWSEVATVSRTQ